MPVFRPGKPRLHVHQASSQTLTASATVKVTLDTTDYVDGDLSVASSVITCNRAGLYLITAQLVIAAQGSNSRGNLWLALNGTHVVGSSKNADTRLWCFNVSLLEELAIGDELQLDYENTIGNAGATNAPLPSLGITRVGPVRWTG